MQLSLVCPFRTLVNIDGELGQGDPPAFERLFRSVAARAGEATGVSFDCHISDVLADGFTRYASLDTDHAPGFTQPLAEVVLPSDRLNSLLRHAEDQTPPPKPIVDALDSLRLGIYDNGIAIFRADLRFDIDQAAGSFATPGMFEAHLTDWAAATATKIQQDYVEPWLKALISIAGEQTRGRNALQKLVLTPQSYPLFDELSRHPFPAWDKGVCPLLWAHRCFHVAGLDASQSARLSPLLRQPLLPARPSGFLTRWGSTLIWDPAIADRVIKMNIANQYFYCLLDTVNYSQKRLLRTVSSPSVSPALPATARRFDRQQNMISMIENEMLDFEAGLQDISHDVFDQIREAFGTETLSAAITRRSKLLQERIDRLVQRRSMGQRRLIAYVFVLVGSAQIIQVIQNFFWYTADADVNADPWPGVTTLARTLSFNLTMNILFLAVLIGGAIWAFRGEGRSRGSDR